MSTVDKMLIKGIRAFDPDNTRVITFFRPLTLIVGPNGAGKTTIIECLKHACTGELPPNSRSGHTFIHDPKVAGETETKGQIKLRFKTAAGKDVVCIRSFQLTQKASKMEYKAIESVIQTLDHNGEKVALSYKCADIDREIPALMGVSKAILENVIFVHQDEANWPLAEPAVLKRKFDDIFSATRYTKALEVLKKLHKDQAQGIKMYKLKLENLRTLKDAAHKFQENIDQDQGKSEFLRKQIRDLENTISDSRRRISLMEEGLRDYEELKNDIAIKKSERRMLKKQKDEQFAALGEQIEEPTEELEGWQNEFNDKIALLRQSQMTLDRNLEDAEAEVKKLSDQHSRNYALQGKLQAEVEGNEKAKAELENDIRKVFAEHNLGNVGTRLTYEEDRRLVHRVGQQFEELNKDYYQLKEANRVQIDKLWRAVQEASEEYLGAKNKVTAKQEKRTAIEADISQLEEEIAGSEVSENDKRRYEAQEAKAIDECKALEAKEEDAQYEARIEEGKRSLTDLDTRLKYLRREKDMLASESADLAGLRVKQEELADKEHTLQRVVAEKKEAIKKVLRTIPESKDLKREIEAALGVSKANATETAQKCSNAEKEVVKVDSRIQETSSSLSKYQRDRDSKRKMLLGRLETILKQNVDVAEFPEQLQKAIDERDQLKSDHDLSDGMKRIYDPFERVAKQTHACPCCDRAFSAEEEHNFVKKQRVLASQSADTLRKLAEKASDAEVKVQQLDKLRPIYGDYQKLSNELIPAAEKNLEELRQEKARLTDAHEDMLGLLADAEAAVEALEKLQVPADRITELFKDIQSVRKQVADQEYKLDTRAQGARPMEEIAAEISSVEEKRDDLYRRVEKMREEHGYLKDDLITWGHKMRIAREEKSNALNKCAEVDRKKKEKEKLVDEIAQIDIDIEICKETLASAKQKKERIEKEHTDLKNTKAMEEDVCLQDLNKFKQEVDKLRNLLDKLQKFSLSRKEEEFGKLNEQIKRQKAELSEKELQVKNFRDDLTKVAGNLGRQTELKRNIDDNIQYRKLLEDEEEMTRTIEELEEQLASKGDLRTLEADLKRANVDLQRLLSEQNRSQGTIAVYESNVGKNKAELNQPQYKDIEKRYSTQLIQLKTTEMANKDLDKYYHALDKALLRFHSMKMEEINKIVKELWQQTYRGQDIDFIEIRSDAEGVGTRSYSYRVVMRSGDAELDMRGRCSAGQKVLASLIIRLALAETFCLNCGILALDEPTTNLDTPNAESLATALLRIMEDRRGQENFQLIVITHDERFAQLIGQRQHAERYYRISKDDHQHSIIESQDIFD
ncbi:hypothetical protein KC19_2G141300 [Ceratodon purpureus]|uniref:DNA repair protein RAD50 n=1 Tax=Ceratodon purpureus TaxID=3225 RepID=A0A8T0IXK6_CERPU|nr:hypothetical protein KC19_2G141300 [Ceratodon purpureus]